MAKGILIRNGGGISLPTLTNEATSDELLVGKELINSEGKILVGTGDLVELNFEVVGGTTQPTSPKENTIWVNTDTEISAWAFSADEPTEPMEGAVWLKVRNSSPASFNALKKNMLMVYMASAEQYVSGAWVGKAAMIFIGGQWRELVEIIFDGSEDFSNWIPDIAHGAGGTCTLQGDEILIHCNKTNQYGSHGVVQIHFIGFTDLSNYKTIRVTFGAVSGILRRHAIGVTSSSDFSHISPTDAGNWIASTIIDKGDFYNPTEFQPLECSIESVNEGYVSVYVMGGVSDISITKIELF